ncbi:MAG: tetratricopeptide repeat protein, partial [Silvibacterium sp.]
MNRPVVTTAASILAAVALLATGCHSGGRLPDPSSKGYAEEVSAFYVGLAALQVGDDVRAQSTLEQATQLAPGEPAAWANWGILALRQRNFDPAAERLNRARQLAPQNGQMYYLLGLLGSARGDSQQAIINLRKAVSLDPKNLRASYALALEVERQGAAGSEEEFQKLIQQILAAQPNNLAALLELSRISAKRGDSVTLHATIQRISAQSATWPADVKQQLAELD